MFLSFAYKKRPGWETVFTGLRMKRAAWATKVCTHAFMSPENGDKGDKQKNLWPVILTETNK